MFDTNTKPADASTQAVIAGVRQGRKQKSVSQRLAARQRSLETNQERVASDAADREMIRYARTDLDEYVDASAQPGVKRGQYQFTAEVDSYIETAAKAFVGNLFSGEWFKYEVANLPEGDESLRDASEKGMQKWADHVRQVLDDINFVGTMVNVAKDMLSQRGGMVYVGEGNDSTEPETFRRPFLQYTEVMGCWFTRDRLGRLRIVHQLVALSADEAYGRWGTLCSDGLIADAEGDKPGNTYRFYRCVMPATDPMLTDLTLGFDPANKPWVEVWYQDASDKNDFATHSDYLAGVLEIGGYPTHPFMDWPHSLKSGEVYGRSRLKLKTVKQLHLEWKKLHLATERALGGPLLADKQLKGKLRLGYDEVTYRDNPNLTAEPIYRNGVGWSFGMNVIEDLRSQIKDQLGLPIFLSMTMKTKDMRVDEVHQVIGEQATVLGPEIGQLSFLFLERFHERILQIERDANRLPKVFTDDRAASIRVKYTGLLGVVQQMMIVQRRMTSGIMTLQPLAAMAPEAMAEAIEDRVNLEVAVEDVLDTTNFLQSAMRSDDEVQARQEQRLQDRAAANRAQTDKLNAEAYSKDAQAAAIQAGVS